MVNFVNHFDAKLDSLENENNVDYVGTPVEDELLDNYGCFLRDMENLP